MIGGSYYDAFGIFFRGVEVKGEVGLADVGAEGEVLLFGVAEQDFGGIEVFDRDLAVESEAADGFDVLVEEFNPDGPGLLPRKDVEDAAAPGELTTGENLRDLFVTGCGELFFEGSEVVAVADFEGEAVAAEGIAGWNGEGELGGGDDDAERLAVGQSTEDVEALGEDLGVGDAFVGGDLLELGEKGGSGSPGGDIGGDFLLTTDVGGDDPDGFFVSGGRGRWRGRVGLRSRRSRIFDFRFSIFD